MNKKTRRMVAVRLAEGGMAEIRALAEQETEGNVSQMVRKLLGEALDARARARALDGVRF